MQASPALAKVGRLFLLSRAGELFSHRRRVAGHRQVGAREMRVLRPSRLSRPERLLWLPGVRHVAAAWLHDPEVDAEEIVGRSGRTFVAGTLTTFRGRVEITQRAANGTPYAVIGDRSHLLGRGGHAGALAARSSGRRPHVRSARSKGARGLFRGRPFRVRLETQMLSMRSRFALPDGRFA